MAALVKAGDAVGRMKLAHIETADFIPAARDGSLDFQSRIRVGLPAAKLADVIGGGGRRLSEARRRREEKQGRQKEVAQSPARPQVLLWDCEQRATGHEIHTLASDNHASFVPRG